MSSEMIQCKERNYMKLYELNGDSMPEKQLEHRARYTDKYVAYGDCVLKHNKHIKRSAFEKKGVAYKGFSIFRLNEPFADYPIEQCKCCRWTKL